MNKPSKKKMQHLQCSMMIYKIVTIKIQAIQYENVALQAQRDAYQAQLQRCQDQICGLTIVMFLLQMIQVKRTML